VNSKTVRRRIDSGSTLSCQASVELDATLAATHCKSQVDRLILDFSIQERLLKDGNIAKRSDSYAKQEYQEFAQTKKKMFAQFI
jgi:hypothetical protein